MQATLLRALPDSLSPVTQHMSGPGSDALVDDFVDRRVECVSSFPVNFFCTALESTATLFQYLSKTIDGVSGMNSVSVFKVRCGRGGWANRQQCAAGAWAGAITGTCHSCAPRLGDSAPPSLCG